MPRATSSPSASSTCTRSRPLACTISTKNDAPRARSAVATRSAAPDKPCSAQSAEPNARQLGSAARGTIAIGDVATVLARPGGGAPFGRGRHQTTSPAAHS